MLQNLRHNKFVKAVVFAGAFSIVAGGVKVKQLYDQGKEKIAHYTDNKSPDPSDLGNYGTPPDAYSQKVYQEVCDLLNIPEEERPPLRMVNYIDPRAEFDAEALFNPNANYLQAEDSTLAVDDIIIIDQSLPAILNKDELTALLLHEMGHKINPPPSRPRLPDNPFLESLLGEGEWKDYLESEKKDTFPAAKQTAYEEVVRKNGENKIRYEQEMCEWYAELREGEFQADEFPKKFGYAAAQQSALEKITQFRESRQLPPEQTEKFALDMQTYLKIEEIKHKFENSLNGKTTGAKDASEASRHSCNHSTHPTNDERINRLRSR